jgi:rod shape-determining protein MreC
MGRLSWRLTRGRGALPASFAVCVALALAIAIAGKTQAPFIDEARTGISDFAAPALTAIRTPLTAFEHFASGVGNYFTVYGENERLRAENAELRKWQNVALSLEDKMRRYEELLNAAAGRQTKAVTARVIGESNRPFVSTMILSAGFKDGVRKGQAVVDERGMIGRIYLTGDHTSWVILLTDLNSRIPVAVEPSHRRAFLAGGNTATPALELDADEDDVHEGDRVLTTGDGGLLPPDLPVGTVMKNSGSYQVSLFANAGASDYVQVLDYGDAAGIPVATAADVVIRRTPEPMPDLAAERREAQRDSGPLRANLPDEVPETAEGEDR